MDMAGAGCFTETADCVSYYCREEGSVTLWNLKAQPADRNVVLLCGGNFVDDGLRRDPGILRCQDGSADNDEVRASLDGFRGSRSPRLIILLCCRAVLV